MIYTRVLHLKSMMLRKFGFLKEIPLYYLWTFVLHYL